MIVISTVITMNVII